jgi:phosphatidylserine/phosphatidylglycerophosphate/cardiolipin synthase-like enzyme
LIDRAEHEIDMAAYVLTDWPVMQALTRAADRGVKVGIYLDGTQLAGPARRSNAARAIAGPEFAAMDFEPWQEGGWFHDVRNRVAGSQALRRDRFRQLLE